MFCYTNKIICKNRDNKNILLQKQYVWFYQQNVWLLRQKFYLLSLILLPEQNHLFPCTEYRSFSFIYKHPHWNSSWCPKNDFLIKWRNNVFLSARIFVLATWIVFLQYERNSCWKKKNLAARKQLFRHFRKHISRSRPTEDFLSSGFPIQWFYKILEN